MSSVIIEGNNSTFIALSKRKDERWDVDDDEDEDDHGTFPFPTPDQGLRFSCYSSESSFGDPLAVTHDDKEEDGDPDLKNVDLVLPSKYTGFSYMLLPQSLIQGISSLVWSSSSSKPTFIYIGVGNTVKCFQLNAFRNLNDAKEKWSVKVNRNHRPMHLQYSNDLVIVTCGLELHVINADDGKVLYREKYVKQVDKDDRPLAILMSSHVIDADLYISCGFQIHSRSLREKIDHWQTPLRLFFSTPITPAFSTFLYCENVLVIGVPGMCICLQTDGSIKWKTQLHPYIDPEKWHGEVPTFAYVGDSRLFLFCGNEIFELNLKNGSVISELVLPPMGAPTPMLNVYDKELDPANMYILKMGVLYKVPTDPPIRIVLCTALTECSATSASSMTVDPINKRLFVAFSEKRKVMCVDPESMSILWQRDFHSLVPSPFVTTILYTKNMLTSGAILLCVGNEVHLFDPEKGIEYQSFSMDSSMDNVCSICTQDASFDLQSSGFLHNVYTKAWSKYTSSSG